MFKIKNKKIIILVIILYFTFVNRTILIYIQKNNLINHKPKISVIIPVYNGEKYINYSLRSVQIQKMKDIEIIIVNDNSNDDSLKIIKSFMKNDKRIRLIKNKETRKILFCKSIAVLNSKGKYIIELDQDDMFIGNDTFYFLYKESEKFNLDLLHFKFAAGDNILNLPKIDNNIINENIIEKQPKLKFTVFNTNICVLWGNLIRTDLYKKVIYNLWPVIINYQIIFQEDFLITFFLLIYAKKYRKIKNIFYFYLLNKKGASNIATNNLEYYLSVIFAGIIYYDYYIDYYSQDIQIIINYIDFLKGHFKIIKKLYNSLFNYFFGKILSHAKLSNQKKIRIMKDFNISENCDSYSYLNRNQSFFINESFLKKQNIYITNNQLIKLSIIIICTNHEKIIRIINSINAQKLEYLEVILIYDDVNNKNKFNLLNDYIKSYQHIKLIEHKIKKGIVYSISEGIIVSKGKYLMILNPNCFFLTTDFIKNIYQEIEKEETDIIEFKLYKILPNNYINLYRCKHFSSQINLKKIKYNLDAKEIDIKNELLTNKLFKSNYFKQMIKKYKLDEIKEIIDYYYNNIFLFILESNNHKFKNISSINIFINDSDCDKYKFNDFTRTESKLIKDTIFYINFIFDNSKNTYENKERVLQEFFNVLSIIFNKFTKISNSAHKLIKKFFHCKYISKTNKLLLKFYYTSLIN